MALSDILKAECVHVICWINVAGELYRLKGREG